jgi:hypothetical protein
MLIIFDDAVAHIKTLANHPDFISLFYNRRHLLHNGTVSFIVTTQKWNLLPTFIRSACNMLVLFPLSSHQI